jgi:hypothetical protein
VDGADQWRCACPPAHLLLLLSCKSASKSFAILSSASHDRRPWFAGIYPRIIETDYFTDGEYRIDSAASPVMRSSLMYKLCYYRFGEVQTQWGALPCRGGKLLLNVGMRVCIAGQPAGWDRTRNAEVGEKDIKLTHLEEAYTTQHWMVRIYRCVAGNCPSPQTSADKHAGVCAAE